MEKKQLFDNSLVGFHPETFLPLFELDINIDDNDIYGDFNITKNITIDDNFIDIYNKIKKAELCTILLNITNNNSDNSNAGFSGYRGTSSLFFRDTVILKSTEKILISNFDITNINISAKTASVNFIRKVISQSDLDNTIVTLTTRVNGLADLTIGGFNETVILDDTEYNELDKISVGEIFTLIDNNSDIAYFTVKLSNSKFRSIKNVSLSYTDHTNVIYFHLNLSGSNQAIFEGRIEQLMDPDNYIAKDNTTEYTPTADYNPATKKYVDDTIDRPLLDISNLLQKIKDAGKNTSVDVTNEIIDLFGSVSAIKTNKSKYRYVSNAGFINFNDFLNINEFTYSAVYGGVYNENDGSVTYPNKSFLSIYYYNFKINDSDTVVTAYYDVINIDKDPDRPNQYLSTDGTYKYPYAAGIFFSEDNRQAINRNYWGNYIIEKQNNNGNCTLVLISDCTKIFDETVTTDLNVDNIFGIGGYGILNRFNGYPYSKPILIEAIIGINETSYFTNKLFTNNWRILPCVVKYQNKYYVAIRFGNINSIGAGSIVMGSYLNIIGQASNLLDSYIYLNCEEGQLYPTGVEVIQEGIYFDKDNLKYDRNNLLAKTDEDGYMSKEDKTKLDNTPTQKILTESEYAALGTTPQTDNILYFVTPD